MKRSIYIILLVSICSCYNNEAGKTSEENSSSNILETYNAAVQDQLEFTLRLDSSYIDTVLYNYFSSTQNGLHVNFDTLYFMSYSITNSSNHYICYFSMACSHYDFIESNNDNYKILRSNCYQNFPIVGHAPNNKNFWHSIVAKKLTNSIDTLSLRFTFYPINCLMTQDSVIDFSLDLHNDSEHPSFIIHSNKIIF